MSSFGMVGIGRTPDCSGTYRSGHQTLEKMAGALEVPMYDLMCDGDNTRTHGTEQAKMNGEVTERPHVS